MRVNRATCDRCGKEFSPPWFGAASRLCPECRKEDQGPRIRTMADVQAAADSGLSMTTVIVGLNVAVFIGMTLSGVSLTEPTGRQLLAWGADFGPLTLGSQPWRAFTYMFVHAGILHIAFNMWAFWYLGKLAERLFGRITFAVLYVLCGFGSALASLAWHPATISVGASGAIFGVAGVLFAYLKLKHVGMPQEHSRRLLSSLGAFMLYNLLFGAAIPFIDNAGHVGGLATGLALGALLPRPVFHDEARSPFRYFAFPLVAVLLLLGGWGLQRRDSGPLELGAGAELVQAGDYDGAIPHLEKAARILPNDPGAHLLLGYAYMHKDRYADAVRELSRAVQLAPQSYDAHVYLGFSYLRLHRLDDAGPELQKAVTLNSQGPEGHYYLGLFFLEQGQYGPAVAELETAQDLDPQNAEVRNALTDAEAKWQKQQRAPAPKAGSPASKIVPNK